MGTSEQKRSKEWSFSFNCMPSEWALSFPWTCNKHRNENMICSSLLCMRMDWVGWMNEWMAMGCACASFSFPFTLLILTLIQSAWTGCVLCYSAMAGRCREHFFVVNNTRNSLVTFFVWCSSPSLFFFWSLVRSRRERERERARDGRDIRLQNTHTYTPSINVHSNHEKHSKATSRPNHSFCLDTPSNQTCGI